MCTFEYLTKKTQRRYSDIDKCSIAEYDCYVTGNFWGFHVPVGAIKMKNKLLSISTVFTLAILALLSGGCASIPIDDQAVNFQEQSNELSRQLAVNQQQLANTQQQLAATQQQLALMQQQLANTQQQLADTQKKLADAQNQIAAAPAATNCYPNEIPTYYPGPYTPRPGPCPSPYPVPYPMPPSPCPSPYPPAYPACPPNNPWHYPPQYLAQQQGTGTGFYDLNDTY
jgi:hypothetical protein